MIGRKALLIGIIAAALHSTGAGCGPTASLGASCGGGSGASCFGPFFCFFEEGCGDADDAGVCQPIPEICLEVFEPVCGCDGETYGNRCFAWASGVNVASDGECASVP